MANPVTDDGEDSPDVIDGTYEDDINGLPAEVVNAMRAIVAENLQRQRELAAWIADLDPQANMLGVESLRFAIELAKLVLARESGYPTVYVVSIYAEDPAVFATRNDANRYAEARDGVVSNALVCSGSLAEKMIEDAESEA